jgi:hypothetical protein
VPVEQRLLLQQLQNSISSHGYIIRKQEKSQLNSPPYEPDTRHTASLLQARHPLEAQHMQDGTLLDRSRNTANHPNGDISDNDHHSECFLTKQPLEITNTTLSKNISQCSTNNLVLWFSNCIFPTKTIRNFEKV